MAPPSVSDAVVVASGSLLSSVSEVGGMVLAELGLKVLSGGAEPGGRVFAVNSGTAALPTSTPGLCFESVSVYICE